MITHWTPTALEYNQRRERAAVLLAAVTVGYQDLGDRAQAERARRAGPDGPGMTDLEAMESVYDDVVAGRIR